MNNNEADAVIATSQPSYYFRPEDKNFALEMLNRIAFVRAFEAKALGLSQSNPQRVVGSMHFCAGQEAVALGAIAGLREDDQILTTYRGHAWALAAGLSPYEVFAEICHREDGVNGGRAGSALLMAPHTRFIGENSIVGAGTTIACGIALANTLSENGRVALVSIGDGAMNQGAVHEAMAFAIVKKLPIIFVVENNGWSELTATGDMFRIQCLAQRATAYGISGATISGVDPIVVRDSIKVAAERTRNGGGPCLIECNVPRLWGHYNRDIEHYRPKADKREAKQRDPLSLLGERLVAAGIMTKEQVQAVYCEQESEVERLAEKALNAPLPSCGNVLEHVVAKTAPSRLLPNVLETREMSYIEAVNAALRAELTNNANTIVYGEDVGKAGGIFGAAKLLQRDFGAERVFDTPIAENAILGSAVGAALAGLKPIVEIMWADFLFVALDQLVNQAANIRYLTRGRSSVPMVVRTQQGATPGSCAQHSQCIEAMLAHVPGIKVALPATPQDAYSLLRAAAADPDPCVVIEARGLYASRGKVEVTAVAEQVGLARRYGNGADAAIITWGAMLPLAIDASLELKKMGIDISVLDLRWLSPLDEYTIVEVVEHCCGKVLIVHEAVRTGGFGAEIVARIHELCGANLKLSLRRLTTPDIRLPAAPSLQNLLLPNSAIMVKEIKKLIE